MLAKLFANQIIKGKLTFAEVPKCLKEQVKEILIDAGLESLVVEE